MPDFDSLLHMFNAREFEKKTVNYFPATWFISALIKIIEKLKFTSCYVVLNTFSFILFFYHSYFSVKMF